MGRFLDAYYGWRIVAALFVMLTFSSGLGFYIHAVMLEALSAERGFPLTTASTAVSIFFFASGIIGPLIALLLERFDVRHVISGGALLAAASLAAVGFVDTTAQLFIVYVLFGVGFCASGLLPATTLVTRWFQKRRAAALSIASTGLSLGGVVVTPACAALIDQVGISVASPWLGFAYLIGVSPLALLVLYSRPADIGLAPDGGDLATSVAGNQGIVFSAAIRSAYFWSLGFAYIFVMAAQVGGIAHQYGIVGEHLSGTAAVLALGVLPLFSILGRLAGGALIDRVSTWRFTAGMIGLQGASLGLMAFSPNTIVLIIGLSIFGITVGNLLMLQPLLIAETFGLINYARIYSTSNLLSMCGVAAGPILMGFTVETTGSYFAAYLLASGAGLFALLLFVPVRPPLHGAVEP